ncbi:hypothetical protein D041_4001B, partial [Vibrio parahaemolyticus EKP-008]
NLSRSPQCALVSAA